MKLLFHHFGLILIFQFSLQILAIPPYYFSRIQIIYFPYYSALNVVKKLQYHFNFY